MTVRVQEQKQLIEQERRRKERCFSAKLTRQGKTKERKNSQLSFINSVRLERSSSSSSFFFFSLRTKLQETSTSMDRMMINIFLSNSLLLNEQSTIFSFVFFC